MSQFSFIVSVTLSEDVPHTVFSTVVTPYKKQHSDKTPWHPPVSLQRGKLGPGRKQLPGECSTGEGHGIGVLGPLVQLHK